MSRTANSPLQQQISSLKRAAILKAAQTVFTEKGFHRATIKEIAAKADVADGTVYNHFKDKNALILALLAKFTESAPTPSADTSQANTAPHSIAAPDLETLIASSTRAHFAMLTVDNLSLFQAVLPEVLSNAELRSAYLEQIVLPTTRAGDTLIESLSSSSGISAAQLKLHFQLEAALFMGLVVLRIIGDPDLERVWEALPTAITELMLASLKAQVTS